MSDSPAAAGDKDLEEVSSMQSMTSSCYQASLSGALVTRI